MDVHESYDGQIHMTARNLYALLIIIIFFRVVQFLRYFRKVGVLTIVVRPRRPTVYRMGVHAVLRHADRRSC